jgi:hypothetical protein
MDHITDLPECNRFNCILVVVCRLKKQGVFIPTRKDDDAKDLVRQFINQVFSKHRLPIDITSDRGAVFVSSFWQELGNVLGVRSNLSTAFHPQTDGQTECVNQSLEQYLRLYINYLQDDWVDHLPIAKFAYNNTKHNSIGVTPFFANKGFHPTLNIDLMRISHLEAQKAARELSELHKFCKEQMQISNETHARFANEKRLEGPNWRTGKHVWLNKKNIKTRRPMKKLDHKNIGPFVIVKKVGTHAYRLNLPAEWKIHPVFHVSLLSDAHDDPFPERQVIKPPPVEIDGEEEFEVERVLDSRWRWRGKKSWIEYLVEFIGLPDPSKYKWLPQEEILHVMDCVKDFHKEFPKKSRPEVDSE